MVIQNRGNGIPRRRGSMMIELVIGIALLVGVLMPLVLSMLKDQRLCRAYYYRAVAMEIVDGEM
jgi:hypothetical protein